MDNFSGNCGFWEENYSITIRRIIERGFEDEVLKNWYISDIIVKNPDKILIKWDKRVIPLTQEEIIKTYRSF